jgi:hypothetical protein
LTSLSYFVNVRFNVGKAVGATGSAASINGATKFSNAIADASDPPDADTHVLTVTGVPFTVPWIVSASPTDETEVIT